MEPLLTVEKLQVQVQSARGLVALVEDVDFAIKPGETLAMVGESGCGKTVTCLSLLRLLPEPPARITGKQVLFSGRDLLQLSEEELQGIRGREIAYVFQEPMTALNPVYTVGDQICEGLRWHQGLSKGQARRRAKELLNLVQVSQAEKRMVQYPHQLSGGLCQRVMLAMALACSPRLLIADEPTTALDVTIQAQILALLQDLNRSLGMALLLVTHDLGLVAERADRVLVMYAGRVFEEGVAAALFEQPFHPYTRSLLASRPRLEGTGEELRPIPGVVPPVEELPPGCKFHPRCYAAQDICRQREPFLRELDNGRQVRCWLADELGGSSLGPGRWVL